MVLAFDLPAIERAFLDAAVDPTRWNDAMDVAGAATGSFGSIIIPFPRGAQPFLPTSASRGPCIDFYIRNGWYARDERERALSRIRQTGIAVDLDMITPDEMARHPFYQEGLAPFGLKWFAGVRMMADNDFWCLAIQRTSGQLPFSVDEQKELAQFSERLAAIGTLTRALGTTRAKAALQALDITDTGAVMINRLGEATGCNAAAEKIIGPDLQMIRKKLTPANREAASSLDRALHDLLWNPNPSVLAPPVLLPRRSGAGILAYPMRLEGVSRDALAPCRAIILLRDLDARPRPPEEALRRTFGLTVAEAKIAARIAAGDTLENIADDSGIASQTARNQLKSVFAKTGIGRQSELVALLARFIAEPEKESGK